MSMFCRAALVLWMTGVACSQSVIDYKTTPAILGLVVPSPDAHCNVFAQHPNVGQVQVACYLGTALVFNGVMTISINQAFTCSAVSPSFNIAWALVPDASPAIKFQVAASSMATGSPLFFAAPIFSSPGVAALGGIF